MFEKLFEFSPDAILVTDLKGRIRGANTESENLFGYRREELIDQPIEILIPARFRSRHPAYRENYATHPRTRAMGAGLGLFGLRKDGTEFPVDIMLKPVETTSGSIVLSFVRDVTEQRAIDEAARRSEEQLRSIVESVKDYAIFLLDPEGRVATWNPAPSASRAMPPMRSSANTSPSSIQAKTSSAASLPKNCASPPQAGASKTKAGACVRMAPASGPTSSLPPFAIKSCFPSHRSIVVS